MWRLHYPKGEFDFHPVDLKISQKSVTDVFSMYTKKTVFEILMNKHFLNVRAGKTKTHVKDLSLKNKNKVLAAINKYPTASKSAKNMYLSDKYGPLLNMLVTNYSQRLEEVLGPFLLDLKQNSDTNYQAFLNPNGDKTYCRFGFLDDPNFNFNNRKGLYMYTINKSDDPMYIGKVTKNRTFRNRINNEEGKISPKSCFLDGQSTDCKINAQVFKHRDRVKLWLCALDTDDELISAYETLLIKGNGPPPWNYK